jgi:hypothetical protein
MSAGGSFNPSGGPIDNQQRLQTSPNPSLPPADYSMGYARNFQPPSFFNPFSGYYGANTGMGGFQPQFGGFQQPQFGGFGGFQQPQYGGFQQQQFGGFGGGFQQPFGGGFGRQSNRFTRRGQEYTQPYMPQPQPPQMPPDFGSGMGGFGGFNPMMGGGIGAFGGFQQQRDPNAPPPGMMVNPDYDSSQAMLMNRPLPGSRESLVRQPFIRDQSQPERLPANMMGGFGGFTKKGIYRNNQMLKSTLIASATVRPGLIRPSTRLNEKFGPVVVLVHCLVVLAGALHNPHEPRYLTCPIWKDQLPDPTSCPLPERIRVMGYGTGKHR